MMLASADVAFAQKQLKYVPKALGAKPTKIPSVVNPKLPPEVRINFAMPTLKQNFCLPTEVQRAAAQRVLKTSTVSTVNPKRKQIPEQIVKDLELFIKENKRFPSQYSQDPKERALHHAVNNTIFRAEKTSQDPSIIRLRDLKNKYSSTNKKTPQQIFDELDAFIQERGRMPRAIIFRNGRPISQESCTPQEKEELSLEQAFKHFIQKASLAELLRFYRTTDGTGDYILEMDEVPDEVLSPSTAKKVEEIAPVAPSPNIIRLRVTEQTKNLIESRREQTALKREKFDPWLESMKQPKNHAQIVNENTFDALSALSKAIEFDHTVHQTRLEVTYLLDSVNNYVGILGGQKIDKQKSEQTIDEQKNGYYYKLLYRGLVDPTKLPLATNFHVVAEEQGMNWDGKLAPQVEEVKRVHALAATNGTPSSVYLGRDGDMVTRLGIKYTTDLQTVKNDLETTLKHLLPPDYTVRMGMHEIGITAKNSNKFYKGDLHIHLENAATSAGPTGLQIDHSISLKINTKPFVTRYNQETRQLEPLSDKEIAQNYLTLFDKFLDAEARTFLQNLVGNNP